MVRVKDKGVKSLTSGSAILFMDADGGVFGAPPEEIGGVGPKGDKGDTGNPGSQGLPGTKGDKGDPGEPGEDGPQGIQGVPGPQGSGLVPNEYGTLTEAKITAIQTANVDWVFVVNPDADDRANNLAPAGIAGDMSLHIIRFQASGASWRDFGQFTGVQGERGPQGDQGNPGPKGDAGSPGSQGVPGQDGAKGDKGDKGDIGNQGVAGSPGSNGLGVPAGGTTGQFLRKKSNADNDSDWTDYTPGIEIVTDSTTARGLILTDADKLVHMTNAGTKTVTVPAQATIAFPVGTVIVIDNYGAGLLTIAAAATVTVNKAADQTLTLATYQAAALTKIATNEWLLVGGMVAS